MKYSFSIRYDVISNEQSEEKSWISHAFETTGKVPRSELALSP